MRIDTIAEVVRDSVPGGPDILVLQEVENENAMRALVEKGLKGMGYAHFAVLPKKKIAANIGIASRFPILRMSAWSVGAWKKHGLRDVVEAEIDCGGSTLHVLNNHWKSKAGGTRKTEPSRLESAGIVGKRIREILEADPAADIVVAGDMNENLDEYELTGGKYQTALIPAGDRSPSAYSTESIFLAGNARGLGADAGRLVLFEPWLELPKSSRGSYVFQGKWHTMDHILLSPGLFDSKGLSYRWGSFTVVRLPFLLKEDGTPKRWTGLKGQRGYSDHLPLLITLDGEKAK